MFFKKSVLQLVAAGLLLFSPASLFAAAMQVGGTAQRGAIDTLTVEDNASFGNAAAVNMGRIIFQTDSLASATATRDRIVAEGERQLNCRSFRIQRLGTDRFQIDATGGLVSSIKLNGFEIPVGPDSVLSKAGQRFQRNDSGQNPPLPACESSPSLSFYGLIVLVLLLAGGAVWMFRRRMATKGGLA